MTDEELDREWKPSARRPQSTVAQMFSQELMDIFRIDNSVADLDEQVDKRKQQINSQNSELEALEARIREMEARLKGQGPSNNNNTNPNSSSAAAAASSSSAPAPPAKAYPAQQQQDKYAGSRPGTARQGQQAVPGALPPTPAGSEGEFEELSISDTNRAAVVPRPSGASRSHSRAKVSGAGTGAEARTESVPDVHPSSARTNESLLLIPGDDARSIKSVSETASFADYVIVPNPDGDRERDI
ncbi:uncharacterized protein C8A04DRAFT_38634 [Dichotomopilus funicola]|uniref:Uncharacterized protein n=1 Tax=Dichotomopilus funicola TaxID=1934379 RepID=A0AAN6V0R1_9PEZI|nr:hypothetical protein C8A04DRAFT_38634 [Dichotomopilus funicola]